MAITGRWINLRDAMLDRQGRITARNPRRMSVSARIRQRKSKKVRVVRRTPRMK